MTCLKDWPQRNVVSRQSSVIPTGSFRHGIERTEAILFAQMTLKLNFLENICLREAPEREEGASFSGRL